ncbi:MAG: discoidin domain-containing protein [Armatimonadota bacterium]
MRLPWIQTGVAVTMVLVLVGGGPLWAGPTVAGTTNLVAAENDGRIAKYSSQALDENGQPIDKWAVTNLIDGKYVVGSHTPADSYGWRSQGVPSPDSPEWIIFELPQRRLISRVVVDPTTDDPEFLGRWAKNIRISVSTESVDGPYKEVGSYVVVRRGIKQTFDFTPVEARWVKLDITSNWGSDFAVELGEFEVYEAIVGDDMLDQLISRLSTLLDELKRYRDSQAYQQHQENTEAVTAKPEPPAEEPAGQETAPEEEGGEAAADQERQ